MDNEGPVPDKVQAAATEAIGWVVIWLRRARLAYDFLSILAFISLGFYFYVSHKQARQAAEELKVSHEKERAALDQLATLRIEGKRIEFIIRTNYIAIQNSERMQNEMESNARGAGTNWRLVLRSISN